MLLLWFWFCLCSRWEINDMFWNASCYTSLSKDICHLYFRPVCDKFYPVIMAMGKEFIQDSAPVMSNEIMSVWWIQHLIVILSEFLWLFMGYLTILFVFFRDIAVDIIFIPPAMKLRGGILDSNSSSVHPSVRPSIYHRCPGDNLNSFHWISILLGICINWVKILVISIFLVKILDGIEDGHYTSLNMHIMASHVT